MANIIGYKFIFEDNNYYDFEIDINRKPNLNPVEIHEDWTRLGFNQCANCSFSEDSIPVCPVAGDVASVVGKFQKILSYQSAKVIIRDDRREYHKESTVQEGLKSLLGLIMSTSGCPLLKPMKAMAHFHLPFASFEETLFRTVGSYYIKLYFNKNEDKNLSGLVKIYEDLSILNTCFLQRIRAACEQDANLNAILNLFALSNLVNFSLQSGLEELKPFFE